MFLIETLKKSRAVKRELIKNAMFMRSWDATGSLYSDRFIDLMTYDVREASDLPEPYDLPETPYVIDDPFDYAPFPLFPDSNDGMTLEEIGEVIGVTRERVRQIEAIALKKLRHTMEQAEVDGAFKMAVDYNNRHGLGPPLIKSKPVEPKETGVDLRELFPPVPDDEEEPMGNPKWARDKLGIPADALLGREAAELLGWKYGTFNNRTKLRKMKPAGHVKGWTGAQWGYWTLPQIEALRAEWATPVTPKRKEPPKRKVLEIKERVFGHTADFGKAKAFAALLVVKTKVSGIPMTIPVYVQQMARMEDGNHQVKVCFSGPGDSILSSVIVWAKDLLAMDYSPYRTPWDDL